MPFLFNECAAPISQCALAAATLNHRDAFSSVMKYFRDLIRLPKEMVEFCQSFPQLLLLWIVQVESKQQQVGTAAVNGFLTDNGPTLVNGKRTLVCDSAVSVLFPFSSSNWICPLAICHDSWLYWGVVRTDWFLWRGEHSAIALVLTHGNVCTCSMSTKYYPVLLIASQWERIKWLKNKNQTF